jgi:hypothetical protein
MHHTLAIAIPENVDLVREFYRAGPSDDDASRRRFAVPGVVWHVPGDNPVAGRYVGYEQVFSTSDDSDGRAQLTGTTADAVLVTEAGSVIPGAGIGRVRFVTSRTVTDV